MAKSWIEGALKALFGIQADTNHWVAVKEAMEKALGPIKIDIPVEGGDIRAFFEKQTLVGDECRRHRIEHRRVLMCLAMDEAVGEGRTDAEAVVALWDKVTNLRPHESILRFEELETIHGQQQAWYTKFRFKNGTFTNQDKTLNEQPPIRPEFIDKFFANERTLAIIRAAEHEYFGTTPKAEGA